VVVFRDGLRECGADWAALHELLPHRPRDQLRGFYQIHKVEMGFEQALREAGHELV
jgi:hypothetical protein